MDNDKGEWQPMSTVPADTNVELGKWDLLGGLNWRTSTGVASRTRRGFLRSKVEPTFWGEEYTHWRHLPPPPSGTERKEEMP